MTQDEIMAWIMANPEAKVLELSEPEFNRLFLDIPMPRRPEPPIKCRWERNGFFSSDTYIEFDYEAPTYLAAMERYNKLCGEMCNSKELIWLGPYGTIKIRIKQ